MKADDAAAQLTSRLRQMKPHTIRLTQRDDTQRDVGVPKVKRWAWRVAQTLEAYDWVRLEGLDAKGQVIGVIDAPERDEPSDVLEDLSPSAKVAETQGMLSLMLRAQDVALKRQHELLSTVLDGNARLLDAVSARMVAMEEMATRQLAQLQEYARAVAELQAAAAADEGMVDELIKAAPALMPVIMRLLGPGKLGAAAPSNGVAKS